MKVELFLKVLTPRNLQDLPAAQAAIGTVDAGVFSSPTAKPHQTDLDTGKAYSSNFNTESTSSSSVQIADQLLMAITRLR